MNFLPYYCPTFRTEHLLEPCPKNLARVKALQEKKKHIGPLERCVECKGKVLITNPKTIIEGLPAPESWIEKQFVKEFKPYRQDWNKSLEEGRLSTEQETLVVHPVIPARPYPKGGHNLGKKYKKRGKTDLNLPKFPITEEDKYPKQEEILPELPKTKELSGSDPDFTRELSTEGRVAEMRGPVPWLDPVRGARYCPAHPEKLQRIDKLGRWMGMCAECLSARGKKCGEQNFERGVTAPPVSIPLNMPKWAEMKEWLAAQAEENERSLGQQIMFTLKMAWRQGI